MFSLVNKDFLYFNFYSKKSLKIPQGVIKIEEGQQHNGQKEKDKQTTIYKTLHSS